MSQERTAGFIVCTEGEQEAIYQSMVDEFRLAERTNNINRENGGGASAMCSSGVEGSHWEADGSEQELHTSLEHTEAHAEEGDTNHSRCDDVLQIGTVANDERLERSAGQTSHSQSITPRNTDNGQNPSTSIISSLLGFGTKGSSNDGTNSLQAQQLEIRTAPGKRTRGDSNTLEPRKRLRRASSQTGPHQAPLPETTSSDILSLPLTYPISFDKDKEGLIGKLFERRLVDKPRDRSRFIKGKRVKRKYYLKGYQACCQYRHPLTGEVCSQLLNSDTPHNLHRHLAIHADSEQSMLASERIGMSNALMVMQLPQFDLLCNVQGCNYQAKVWKKDKAKRDHNEKFHPWLVKEKKGKKTE